jgi:hypothetical protein
MGASGWQGNCGADTPVHERRQLFRRTGQPGAGATLDGRATQDRLASSAHDDRRDLDPLHDENFQASPMDYYCSAYQTEWATDIIVKTPAVTHAC